MEPLFNPPVEAAVHLNVKYKAPREGSSSCGPLLASFLQGPPPATALHPVLDSESDRDLKFRFSVDSRRRGRAELMGSSDVGIEYAARSTETAAAAAGFQYLLGVVNKHKDRITLYPVETGGIFKLQMSTSDLGAAPMAAPKTDKARQEQLISDFGSRKKQKMEASRQANIVNVHAVAAVQVVGQHLQSSSAEAAHAGAAAAGSTGESKIEATLLAGRLATLPPFNADATTPAEVYPLAGIISQTVFAELETSAKLVIRAMEGGGATDELVASLSAGSQFVADRLRKLLSLGIQKHGDSSGGEKTEGRIRKSAAKTRAASLIFLGQLLLLHRAPDRLYFRAPEAIPEFESADAVPAEPRIAALDGVPAAVVTELLASFAEARPAVGASTNPMFYVRTAELRNRLIAHVTVLSVVVDGFATDARLLAVDLRLTLAKVATMFRETGCAVEPVREGGGGAGVVVSYSVQLKTPLTFPKLKFGRR